MTCYAVFDAKTNKQIRVFHYSLGLDDVSRARKLAFEFANKNHANGYPCTVELFHMCDVGKQVLDTRA